MITPTDLKAGLKEETKQIAYTVSQAAEFLGISPNTLRKRSDLGIIPAKRDPSGHRIFLLLDLLRYLNSLPPYQSVSYPVGRRLAETGRKKKGG